jgi:hypothetical protein
VSAFAERLEERGIGDYRLTELEWISWRQMREGGFFLLISMAFRAALAEGMVV